MFEQTDINSIMGLDPMIIGVVVALLVLGFVGWKFMGQSGVSEKRLKAVLDRRESLREEMKAHNAATREDMFQQGWLKDFAMQLRRSTFLQPPSLKKNLLRAGIRGKDAPTIFIIFKL